MSAAKEMNLNLSMLQQPSPSVTQPSRQQPHAETSISVSLLTDPATQVQQDDIVVSTQPTVEMRRTATLFLTTLKVLLGLNLTLYAFESVVGAALTPSAHDLILLLLGYFAVDLYRLRALQIYRKLCTWSIAVDAAALLITMMFIYDNYGWHWIMFLQVALFGIEAWFKVAGIKHVDVLVREIQSKKHLMQLDNV